MKKLRLGAVHFDPVKPGTVFEPSPQWATVKIKTPTGYLVQYFNTDGQKVAEHEE